MSFCYYIKYSNGDYKSPVSYIGLDAAKVFVKMLQEEAIEIKKIYDQKFEMNDLTEEEEEMYNDSNTCHICERNLNELPPAVEKQINVLKNYILFAKDNDDMIEKLKDWKDELRKCLQMVHTNKTKVRDHDHLTGKFRGAAHSYCNLNYRNPNFVPVFIHNLSGYDTHLFIKELAYDTNEIKLIANNEEKYITFSKYVKVGKKNGIHLKFLDSFRFMSKSLAELANNLTK